MRPALDRNAPLLIFDTGSPSVGVALGVAAGPFAVSHLPQRRSANRLLATVDEMLRDVEMDRTSITAIIILRGPGSFTGLRVGLATAIGLAEALDLPVACPSTTAVLATSRASDTTPGTTIAAAVDALRGAWHVRRFATGPDGLVRPLDDGVLVDATALSTVDSAILVGHELPEGVEGPRRLPPRSWAAAAARLALEGDEAQWDPSRRIQPLYFRPPAVTLPSR